MGLDIAPNKLMNNMMRTRQKTIQEISQQSCNRTIFTMSSELKKIILIYSMC